MLSLGLSAFYCVDLVHMAVKSLLAGGELFHVFGPFWEGHKLDAPISTIVSAVNEEAAPFQLAAEKVVAILTSVIAILAFVTS